MDTFFPLILAAICIVIGFLIGQLLSVLARNKNTDQHEIHGEGLVDVLHNPVNGDLIVKIDDHVYIRSNELGGKERGLIHKTILRLNNWLDPVAPAVEMENRVEVRPPDPASIEIPVEKITRPSLNPVHVLTNALRADVPKSKLPSQSIVSQIDDILQEKQKQSPRKGEAVRLMDLPLKGMVVMVGLDQYDGVEDVPDEEIRDLIRAAVKEWEQKV